MSKLDDKDLSKIAAGGPHFENVAPSDPSAPGTPDEKDDGGGGGDSGGGGGGGTPIDGDNPNEGISPG